MIVPAGARPAGRAAAEGRGISVAFYAFLKYDYTIGGASQRSKKVQAVTQSLNGN
jgi:hypothetical protein